MNNQEIQNFVDSEVADDDLEPWQRLNSVVKKWVVMSQHQKTLDNYENLRNSN